MEVRVSDKSSLTRLVHLEKAPLPIFVRVPGNLTVSRLVHPAKALSPMEVRVSGRYSLVRLVQSSNALLGMEGMVLQITTTKTSPLFFLIHSKVLFGIFFPPMNKVPLLRTGLESSSGWVFIVFDKNENKFNSVFNMVNNPI